MALPLWSNTSLWKRPYPVNLLSKTSNNLWMSSKESWPVFGPAYPWMNQNISSSQWLSTQPQATKMTPLITNRQQPKLDVASLLWMKSVEESFIKTIDSFKNFASQKVALDKNKVDPLKPISLSQELGQISVEPTKWSNPFKNLKMWYKIWTEWYARVKNHYYDLFSQWLSDKQILDWDYWFSVPTLTAVKWPYEREKIKNDANCVVSNITDWDTIRAFCLDALTNKWEKKDFRLLWINTPESDVRKIAGKKWLEEPYWKEAWDFLASQFYEWAPLHFSLDSINSPTDQYGRILAWIEDPSHPLSYNEQMVLLWVAESLWWVENKNFANDKQNTILALQEYAKKRKFNIHWWVNAYDELNKIRQKWIKDNQIDYEAPPILESRKWIEAARKNPEIWLIPSVLTNFSKTDLYKWMKSTNETVEAIGWAAVSFIATNWKALLNSLGEWRENMATHLQKRSEAKLSWMISASEQVESEWGNSLQMYFRTQVAKDVHNSEVYAKTAEYTTRMSWVLLTEASSWLFHLWAEMFKFRFSTSIFWAMVLSSDEIEKEFNSVLTKWVNKSKETIKKWVKYEESLDVLRDTPWWQLTEFTWRTLSAIFTISKIDKALSWTKLLKNAPFTRELIAWLTDTTIAVANEELAKKDPNFKDFLANFAVEWTFWTFIDLTIYAVLKKFWLWKKIPNTIWGQKIESNKIDPENLTKEQEEAVELAFYTINNKISDKNWLEVYEQTKTWVKLEDTVMKTDDWYKKLTDVINDWVNRYDMARKNIETQEKMAQIWEIKQWLKSTEEYTISYWKDWWIILSPKWKEISNVKTNQPIIPEKIITKIPDDPSLKAEWDEYLAFQDKSPTWIYDVFYSKENDTFRIISNNPDIDLDGWVIFNVKNWKIVNWDWLPAWKNFWWNTISYLSKKINTTINQSEKLKSITSSLWKNLDNFWELQSFAQKEFWIKVLDLSSDKWFYSKRYQKVFDKFGSQWVWDLLVNDIETQIKNNNKEINRVKDFLKTGKMSVKRNKAKTTFNEFLWWDFEIMFPTKGPTWAKYQRNNLPPTLLDEIEKYFKDIINDYYGRKWKYQKTLEKVENSLWKKMGTKVREFRSEESFLSKYSEISWREFFSWDVIKAFTDWKDIYINPKYASKELLLHEAGHLWRSLANSDVKLKLQMENIISNSDYYKKTKEERADIYWDNEDLLLEESFADALESFTYNKKWLWKSIKDFFITLFEKLLWMFWIKWTSLNAKLNSFRYSNFHDLVQSAGRDIVWLSSFTDKRLSSNADIIKNIKLKQWEDFKWLKVDVDWKWYNPPATKSLYSVEVWKKIDPWKEELSKMWYWVEWKLSKTDMQLYIDPVKKIKLLDPRDKEFINFTNEELWNKLAEAKEDYKTAVWDDKIFLENEMFKIEEAIEFRRQRLEENRNKYFSEKVLVQNKVEDKIKFVARIFDNIAISKNNKWVGPIVAYNRFGVDYAKKNKWIYSWDIFWNTKTHFGNPFVSTKNKYWKDRTPETEWEVLKYLEWLTTDLHSDIFPDRRKWIIDVITSWKLKWRKIFWNFKDWELHSSHVLKFLIDNPEVFNWNDFALSPNLTKRVSSDIKTSELIDNERLETKSFVNHSWWAIWADITWDQIWREFWFVNNKHYYWKKNPHWNTQISKTDFEEWLIKAKEAANSLWRRWTSNDYIQWLLSRNWQQVKNSDSVFAVSRLTSNMKQVDWWTWYAVEMAKTVKKPIYVFDQNSSRWYKWNYEANIFELSDTPVLTKNFAWIWTRELKENWKKAIRDVYEKTLNKISWPKLESGWLLNSSYFEGYLKDIKGKISSTSFKDYSENVDDLKYLENLMSKWRILTKEEWLKVTKSWDGEHNALSYYKEHLEWKSLNEQKEVLKNDIEIIKSNLDWVLNKLKSNDSFIREKKEKSVAPTTISASDLDDFLSGRMSEWFWKTEVMPDWSIKLIKPEDIVTDKDIIEAQNSPKSKEFAMNNNLDRMNKESWWFVADSTKINPKSYWLDRKGFLDFLQWKNKIKDVDTNLEELKSKFNKMKKSDRETYVKLSSWSATFWDRLVYTYKFEMDNRLEIVKKAEALSSTDITKIWEFYEKSKSYVTAATWITKTYIDKKNVNVVILARNWIELNDAGDMLLIDRIETLDKETTWLLSDADKDWAKKRKEEILWKYDSDALSVIKETSDDMRFLYSELIWLYERTRYISWDEWNRLRGLKNYVPFVRDVNEIEWWDLILDWEWASIVKKLEWWESPLKNPYDVFDELVNKNITLAKKNEVYNNFIDNFWQTLGWSKWLTEFWPSYNQTLERIENLEKIIEEKTWFSNEFFQERSFLRDELKELEKDPLDDPRIKENVSWKLLSDYKEFSEKWDIFLSNLKGKIESLTRLLDKNPIQAEYVNLATKLYEFDTKLDNPNLTDAERFKIEASIDWIKKNIKKFKEKHWYVDDKLLKDVIKLKSEILKDKASYREIKIKKDEIYENILNEVNNLKDSSNKNLSKYKGPWVVNKLRKSLIENNLKSEIKNRISELNDKIRLSSTEVGYHLRTLDNLNLELWLLFKKAKLEWDSWKSPISVVNLKTIPVDEVVWYRQKLSLSPDERVILNPVDWNYYHVKIKDEWFRELNDKMITVESWKLVTNWLTPENFIKVRRNWKIYYLSVKDSNLKQALQDKWDSPEWFMFAGMRLYTNMGVSLAVWRYAFYFRYFTNPIKDRAQAKHFFPVFGIKYSRKEWFKMRKAIVDIKKWKIDPNNKFHLWYLEAQNEWSFFGKISDINLWKDKAIRSPSSDNIYKREFKNVNFFKKMWKKMINHIDLIWDANEEATRALIHMKMKEKWHNTFDAVTAAHKIAWDYWAWGRTMKELNPIVSFLNSTYKSVINSYEMIKLNPLAFARSLAIHTILPSTLISFRNIQRTYPEDYHDENKRWKRVIDTFFDPLRIHWIPIVIPVNSENWDFTFIAIPRPHFVWMFGFITETIIEKTTNNQPLNKKDAFDILSVMSSSLNPYWAASGLLPDLPADVITTGLWKKWHWWDIIPSHLEWEQVYEYLKHSASTRRVYKYIAKKTYELTAWTPFSFLIHSPAYTQYLLSEKLWQPWKIVHQTYDSILEPLFDYLVQDSMNWELENKFPQIKYWKLPLVSLFYRDIPDYADARSDGEKATSMIINQKLIEMNSENLERKMRLDTLTNKAMEIRKIDDKNDKQKMYKTLQKDLELYNIEEWEIIDRIELKDGWMRSEDFNLQAMPHADRVDSLYRIYKTIWTSNPIFNDNQQYFDYIMSLKDKWVIIDKNIKDLTEMIEIRKSFKNN